jgi:hypothetical protein
LQIVWYFSLKSIKEIEKILIFFLIGEAKCYGILYSNFRYATHVATYTLFQSWCNCVDVTY